MDAFRKYVQGVVQKAQPFAYEISESFLCITSAFSTVYKSSTTPPPPRNICHSGLLYSVLLYVKCRMLILYLAKHA